MNADKSKKSKKFAIFARHRQEMEESGILPVVTEPETEQSGQREKALDESGILPAVQETTSPKSSPKAIFAKHRQAMDACGPLPAVKLKPKSKKSIFQRHHQSPQKSGILPAVPPLKPSDKQAMQSSGLLPAVKPPKFQATSTPKSTPEQSFAEHRRAMDDASVAPLAKRMRHPRYSAVFDKYHQEVQAAGIVTFSHVDSIKQKKSGLFAIFKRHSQAMAKSQVQAVPEEFQTKEFYVFPTNQKKAVVGETIGLVSGIYGNYRRMEKVMKRLKGKIHYLVCLGDIVGYEADHKKLLRCLRWVQRHVSIIVPGDHEFLHHEKILRTPEDAISLSHKALEKLMEQDRLEITFLKILQCVDISYTLDKQARFLLAHASLCKYSGYTDDHNNIANCFSSMGQGQVLFVGHSLEPAIIFKSGAGATWQNLEVSPGREVSFTVEKEKYIFNTGTIVNPADAKAPAYVLILRITANSKQRHSFSISYEVIT